MAPVVIMPGAGEEPQRIFASEDQDPTTFSLPPHYRATDIVAVVRAIESPEERAERVAREKRKARFIKRVNEELAWTEFRRWQLKETL